MTNQAAKVDMLNRKQALRVAFIMLLSAIFDVSHGQVAHLLINAKLRERDGEKNYDKKQ